jgi:hypothetical protein
MIDRQTDRGARPKSRTGQALKFLPWMILLFFAAPGQSAAELKKETVRAWDQYLQWANAKVQKEVTDPKLFLIQNTLPPKEKASLQKQLQAGKVMVHQRSEVVPSGTHFSVPDGEIHHYWGSIQLKNVRLPELMKFLKDYDHHAGKFADVERSRLLENKGNEYKIYYRLRRSKSFVTAYYNTEQECRYTDYGSNRLFSQSTATKIAELDDPGKASEREKKPGEDRGFLWRLVSWWRFEQSGDDVIVELESASLSRDIPMGIRIIPLLGSYIRSTPRETLESVLVDIRKSIGK